MYCVHGIWHIEKVYIDRRLAGYQKITALIGCHGSNLVPE